MPFKMSAFREMWVILTLGINYSNCHALFLCRPHCVDLKFDENGICTRGCTEGYWGDQCLHKCPSTCSEKSCNRTNGLCNSCPDGHYGDTCAKKCYWSKNCSGGKCNKGRGTCPTGCIFGYYGPYCMESCGNCSSGSCDNSNGNCNVCNTGYYGRKCDRKCNNNCLNQECRKNDGYCKNGCDRGFYGSFCNLLCSKNCAQPKCKQNGDCIGGCKPNWTGEKCDTVVPCSLHCIDMEFDGNGICTRGCIEGYWGDQCLNECPSSCSRRVCNRTNGLCISCKDGNYGHRCEYECNWYTKCYKRACAIDGGYCRLGCVSGYYGNFCEHRCGNCSDTCNTLNGYCRTCNKGFYGKKCDMKCSNTCLNHECRKMNGYCRNGCYRGFYGSFCDSSCSGNCAKIECLQSGICIGGCKPNWSGERCDRCEFGHYGPDCSKICSVNCKRQTCDNVTGSCTYGCINGFYSDKCEKSCSLLCPSTLNGDSVKYESECPVGKYGTYCNKTCNYNCKKGCSRVNGLCDFGCITGKFGVDCLRNCADGCISGCLQEDGSCTCKTGWQGHKCDECSQTHYGPQCDQLCSPICINRICFSNNGSCIRGLQSNLTDEKPYSEIDQILENYSTALYGVIATLCISIIVNIVLIFRNIRQKFPNKEKQETSRRNSIQYANTAMFAEVEANAGYQELGQLSQPSHYDELK